MNDALPEPLVPAEVDLRGLEYMPLMGLHLFGSDFNAQATDAEWRAAVTLWWAAWNQVPAASLPNDDVALCRHADFGRDVRAWRRVRERALHKFVLCSDGRLYHSFLAKQALIAWEKRREDQVARDNEKERKKRERDRRSRMFADLQAVGVTPEWNVSTTDLSRLYEQHCPRDKSEIPRDKSPPVTVTGTAKTGRDGTGRDELNLLPPTPPAGGNGKARVKRVTTAAPDSFDVTDEMAQWAVSQGLPAERVLPETEKCLDHFRGEGRGKADWKATWRNWIRNAVEYSRARR
jgi:uncharacterized protein YdaU (DUF1376 family)